MFSLSHVAIMEGLRKAVYAAMGSAYDFTHGNLLLHLIYEGRKDGLAYLLFLAFFWAYERVTEPRPQAQGDGRIEVKTDGRTLYLAADEIIYAEAAGNYVELHLATKPLLIRGTLSEFEKRLTGFVRIHRSRLLNPVHMKSYVATSSGDLRITLSDGREIVASRRYRDALLNK
ncbi:LytR/AlgR family response regulator transcription factor [Asticcacaulis biprosthecium]|nr:LytTR family DNA-binding domain-containing protein [Asticcacaulis biprosthecium]